ncbi:SPOR domain-containing protein [Ideonella sp.]|uniref:SPOR domain-containing protein n=1 Tax=Ideonella sp. TaxID=1929293 RepID=UPI0035B3368F
MLRLLVAALLVANLVFWGWHFPPVAQMLGLAGVEPGREPQRLQQQIHPELIQLLSPTGAALAPAAPPAAGPATTASASDTPAASTAAAATSPPLCLEAGPLNDSAASTALRELAQAGVPAGSWVDSRRELPGRWIIYMGRYPEREVMQRKIEEVQRLNLNFTELKGPPDLAPGLGLGEFGTQADAQARLDKLRGVRTARVVQLPSPGGEHRIRVDRIQGAAADKLAALNSKDGATRWQTCAP